MQTEESLRVSGAESWRRYLSEAFRGERTTMVIYTLYASAYFEDIPGLYQRVRREIDSSLVETAIAAIFSSSFFFDIHPELLFTLTERVLEGPGEGPDFALERRRKVVAAGEVLEIWADIRSGGPCRRCGKKAG